MDNTLQSVLPATTRMVLNDTVANDLKTILKVPKGLNRTLMYRSVDMVLSGTLVVGGLREGMGLTPTEVAYVTKVVTEIDAWEKALMGAPSELTTLPELKENGKSELVCSPELLAAYGGATLTPELIDDAATRIQANLGEPDHS